MLSTLGNFNTVSILLLGIVKHWQTIQVTKLAAKTGKTMVSKNMIFPKLFALPSA